MLQQGSGPSKPYVLVRAWILRVKGRKPLDEFDLFFPSAERNELCMCVSYEVLQLSCGSSHLDPHLHQTFLHAGQGLAGHTWWISGSDRALPPADRKKSARPTGPPRSWAGVLGGFWGRPHQSIDLPTTCRSFRPFHPSNQLQRQKFCTSDRKIYRYSRYSGPGIDLTDGANGSLENSVDSVVGVTKVAVRSQRPTWPGRWKGCRARLKG